MLRMFPVGFILKECVNDVAKRVFLNVLNVCLANCICFKSVQQLKKYHVVSQYLTTCGQVPSLLRVTI